MDAKFSTCFASEAAPSRAQTSKIAMACPNSVHLETYSAQRKREREREREISSEFGFKVET
jgi:hypothetical protein